MKLQQLISSICVSLMASTLSLPVLVESTNAAEETVVLCEGNRNSARVYRDNGQLKLRMFDRRLQRIWLNAPATSTTNSEGATYSNTQGEAIVKVSVFRVSRQDCTIQVGTLAVENGTVKGDSSGGSPGGNPSQAAACQSAQNIARIYRSTNESLNLQMSNRQQGSIWLNSPAQMTITGDGATYSNTSGQQVVRVSFFRVSRQDCTIQIGNRAAEPGTVLTNDGSSGGSSGGNGSESVVALCQGSENIARIYKRNGALNLQMVYRQQGGIWLNSPARSTTYPDVTTYSNTSGEQRIGVNVSRNSSTCSIQVGGKPLERGSVIERGS